MATSGAIFIWIRITAAVAWESAVLSLMLPRLARSAWGISRTCCSDVTSDWTKSVCALLASLR